jgi:hypothetical protein
MCWFLRYLCPRLTQMAPITGLTCVNPLASAMICGYGTVADSESFTLLPES